MTEQKYTQLLVLRLLNILVYLMSKKRDRLDIASYDSRPHGSLGRKQNNTKKLYSIRKILFLFIRLLFFFDSK